MSGHGTARPGDRDPRAGPSVPHGRENPVTSCIPLAVLPVGRQSFDEYLRAHLDRKRKRMRDALVSSDPQKDGVTSRRSLKSPKPGGFGVGAARAENAAHGRLVDGGGCRVLGWLVEWVGAEECGFGESADAKVGAP